MSFNRFGDGTPISAKGDLVTHNGTKAISISVGTNGQILTAQSSTSTGLLWATPSTGDTQYVTLIATNTLTAAAHSITFSNIPGTYDQLILCMSTKRADASAIASSNIIFNNLTTGTTYKYAYYETNQGASGSTGTTYFPYWLSYTRPTLIELSIPRYASTTETKSGWLASGFGTSSSEYGVLTEHIHWDSTSAITSITIYAGAVADTTYTHASGADNFAHLYGVKWS